MSLSDYGGRPPDLVDRLIALEQSVGYLRRVVEERHGPAAPVRTELARTADIWLGDLRDTLGVDKATDGQVIVRNVTSGLWEPRDNLEFFTVACSDEVTPITTGIAKVTFRMAIGMRLTDIRASLTAASSSGTPTFDVNEGGASILSTKITVDVGETTSETAAVPPVLSDTILDDDDEMTIDFDVAGTDTTGVKITFIGIRL